MMIQERDSELLRRCYEQQFLLMEQLQRYFFSVKTGGQQILRLSRVGLGLVAPEHPIEIP